MREFQRKGRFRDLLYSRASLVLLSILIIFLANSTWAVYKKHKLSRENLDNTKRQYDELLSREGVLEAGIANLSTKEGIEEEIRAKFPVVKQGEEVIIILDRQGDSGSSYDLEEVGFFDKLLNIFK